MTMLRAVAQRCRAPQPLVSAHATRSSRAVSVLFVGPEHEGDAIHDALFENFPSRIFATRDYRELWLLSPEEPFRLAVLHPALSNFDLETTARIVRSRWPWARILVIRAGESLSDKALYDERMTPSVAAGMLSMTVGKLLNERCA
jgi:hypothetical protein